METKKKNDLLLIGGLLLIALLALAGLKLRGMLAGSGGASPEVVVNIDGKEMKTYRLSDTVDIVIEGADGGSNHLVIANGAAQITEASCPDKICVNTGKISEPGEAAVCLPNRVIVTIR